MYIVLKVPPWRPPLGARPPAGWGILTVRHAYAFRPWPPRREPVTDPDAWAVYVAIGSNVIIAREELFGRVLRKMDPERLDAAIAHLRDLGVIDVVTCIQEWRPTYQRLELPLKD